MLYFSLSLFVSAALLFLVQPMIGKMILPHLGGTPAVWNTCMVFFQGALLVGYGYTHLLTTTQPPRRQVLIHGFLLFLPFLVLPFSLGDWAPPSDANPIFSLMIKLTIMVGLPFLMVSTTAPLLQKWFFHTDDPAAKDPYFLYGASNFGSMLSLAIYPTLVEPWLPVSSPADQPTLNTQLILWTVSYGIFVLLVLGCALMVWRALARKVSQKEVTPDQAAFVAPTPSAATMAPQPVMSTAVMSSSRRRSGRVKSATPLKNEPTIAPAALDERVTPWRRLRWIGLAAAPSSLMLGVTTYMTTDIAAVALFWILPLMLYLLTFILVFTRWPTVWTGMPHIVVLFLQPCFLLFLVLKMIAHLAPPMWGEFLLHLAAFFMTALLCHGELARDRPSARFLTEFYFWMSLGGVLGGLFNAFFAPVAFQYGIWEYPLAMVFACLLRPNLVEEVQTMIPGDSTMDHDTPLGHLLDWSVPIAIGLVGYGFAYAGDHYHDRLFLFKRSYLMAILVIMALIVSLRPIRFGLTVAALFLAMGIYDRQHDSLLYEGRGFFGLLRVRASEPDWYRLPVHEEEKPHREWKVYRTLIHGGINHGRQIVEFKYDDGQMIHESNGLTLLKRREPITYFHERNGVAEIYRKFSWPDARMPTSMVGQFCGSFSTWNMLVNTQSEPPYAVLGLGTGILASYAKPYQVVDFYEIDPLVRNLSLPPDGSDPVFWFLQDAKNRGSFLDVKMGDGRLRIKDAPENFYHIISLDAFSSDAIPVHLLTAEAVDLYMSKLVEGGVLIFNTTNRYVRIEPVLSAIAREKGHDCLYCPDFTYETDHPDRFAADWVVLQRRIDKTYRNGGPPIHVRLEKERKRLTWDHRLVLDSQENPIIDQRWREVAPLPGPVWTDSYSNLLKIMNWGW